MIPPSKHLPAIHHLSWLACLPESGFATRMKTLSVMDAKKVVFPSTRVETSLHPLLRLTGDSLSTGTVSIFLICIGALFNHILQYLRTDCGDIRDSLPDSSPALWALVSEAKYFGLTRLHVQIRQKIQRLKVTQEWVGPILDGLISFLSSVAFAWKSIRDMGRNGIPVRFVST